MPASTPSSGKPRWVLNARRLKTATVSRVAKSLEEHAEHLARDSGATVVDTRHVEIAFDALRRCGLVREPFLRRREFQSTIGGLLIGVALGLPGLFELFGFELGQSPIATGVCVGLTVAGVIVGFFLVLQSFFRGLA